MIKEAQKQGYKTWIANFIEKDFTEMEEFDSSKIIYLTPDAEEYLEAVEEDKIYIIGGLVDRQVIKNETLNKATIKGLVAR